MLNILILLHMKEQNLIFLIMFEVNDTDEKWLAF
jgi:hypothetical protein